MTDGDQNKLGEVLRTAREARDVDLARVERDTKIRARYLQALEDGDYAELPGAVYTKGFLRNYGAYLGLDTEYLIDLYRLESSQPATEKPTVPTPPRPISTRRSRPLVVTPGAIMAALLTVGVAIFIIYIVAEFVTFARTPDLEMTAPAGDVAGWDEMEYTIIGTTEPNSRVTVTGCARTRPSPPMPTATSRSWSASVPGSNVIKVVANDLKDEPHQRSDSHDRGRRRALSSLSAPGASPSVVEEVARHRPQRGRPAPHRRTAVLTLGAVLVEQAAPTIRIESLAGDEVPVPTAGHQAPDPVRLTADAQGGTSGTAAGAVRWDLTLAAEGQRP